MTYSVDSVVCDYGVYENINGNRRLCVICNSRANALLVADILNKDYEHQIADMRGKSRMKLIIDIPDNEYKQNKHYYDSVYHGIPLDDVKAVIKAEMNNLADIQSWGRYYGLGNALSILDNIGKAESEDKE